MIWSIVLGVIAYCLIASAGYESAQREIGRYSDRIALVAHIMGIAALASSIYLAANSN